MFSDKLRLFCLLKYITLLDYVNSVLVTNCVIQFMVFNLLIIGILDKTVFHI